MAIFAVVILFNVIYFAKKMQLMCSSFLLQESYILLILPGQKKATPILPLM